MEKTRGLRETGGFSSWTGPLLSLSSVAAREELSVAEKSQKKHTFACAGLASPTLPGPERRGRRTRTGQCAPARPAGWAQRLPCGSAMLLAISPALYLKPNRIVIPTAQCRYYARRPSVSFPVLCSANQCRDVIGPATSAHIAGTPLLWTDPRPSPVIPSTTAGHPRDYSYRTTPSRWRSSTLSSICLSVRPFISSRALPHSIPHDFSSKLYFYSCIFILILFLPYSRPPPLPTSNQPKNIQSTSGPVRAPGSDVSVFRIPTLSRLIFQVRAGCSLLSLHDLHSLHTTLWPQ